MSSVVNIAAYKFVTLSDLAGLQVNMLDQCQSLNLKGTILLAEEGINLFLAGKSAGVDCFLKWLGADAKFADLEVKFSYSDDVPFRKMLVKIKSEIISMNHPSIRPEAGRAPAVDAKILARWLEKGIDDEGRPVVTLDTRNAFEVDAGTFKGSIDWRISKFTEFPDALRAHRAELEGKTIVSFCTGGIRFEKAAIFMAEEGISHIYQLEGGILKYFEEVGGQGYEGNCFVFDERMMLDSGLEPKSLD